MQKIFLFIAVVMVMGHSILPHKHYEEVKTIAHYHHHDEDHKKGNSHHHDQEQNPEDNHTNFFF